jgi:hypothetical protein
MLQIDVCRDLAQAKQLWQRHWPKRCLFDLWPVRACFQSGFNRPPYFLVAREGDRFQGLVALSWLAEAQYYGHFPGETWQGKTWLEQNRILAAGPDVYRALRDHIPSDTMIRYLAPDTQIPNISDREEDEIGFLFFPAQYGFSYSSYLSTFSGKTRKKMRCELDRLSTGGVSYRYDRFDDLDLLFQMNLEGFGEYSYFRDKRFLRSFQALASWLHTNGMLRVTTVLIGGEVAAVDMGAVWNGIYTVLAGGTCAEFPGVAKLINLHHIEWACRQRMAEVDFLCGDFNWKNRFHLTPRPLYQFKRLHAENIWALPETRRRAAVA